MPFFGETIPLSFQLLDSDSSKFCLAIITDPSGAAHPSSPVAMVSIGGGKYSSDAITMPNVDYVEVRYEPYDDAIHTIPDPDHLVGTDVFRLEVPDSVILDKLDEILEKLNALNPPVAEAEIKITADVQDIIYDVLAAKALIQRDNITAIIDDSSRTDVKISGDTGVTVTDEC